jgi:hypothetical protein
MKTNDDVRTKTSRILWHNSAENPRLMGCTTCPLRELCGGLNVGPGRFDCMQHCCGKPAVCDAVCPKKPSEFAWRLREIKGFSLEEIGRVPYLGPSSLPEAIPLIYHGSGRQTPFVYDSVALSLYQVYERGTGAIKFSSLEELGQQFRFSPDAKVVRLATRRPRSG